jgi:hypothetical protein
VYERTLNETISYLQRLWQKGPIYQGSTEEEDGEGDEALTEAATGAVTEAEGDTVRTGAPVAGTSLCLFHDGLMSRADCPPPALTAGEDAATNYWGFGGCESCRIHCLSYTVPL